MADNKPLQPIIKKIKKGGHGHHGGAWKVAYADFVTAMMAFFLLLWLLNATPSEKLKGVAEYFTPTIGVRDKMGMGFEAGNNPQVDGKDKSRKANDNIIFGAPSSGAVVKLPDSVRTKDEIDAKNFTSMQNDLYKAIHKNPELREFTENILIDQTPEGLRIQITDAKDRPMFIPGTSTLQPYMKKILTVIAKYIRYLPNYISVGGHTSLDKSTSKPGSYDQWQLSAERANSARRFLTDGNIDPEQIARIIGKGDTDPLDIKDPYSYKNIRLSLVILKNSILPYSKQSATESDLDINNESSASKEPSTGNE